MQSKRLFTPLYVQATRTRPHRRLRLRWVAAAFVLASLLVWLVVKAPNEMPMPQTPSASSDLPAGPPWIYGQADARFTLTEFADLECPYCQAYFPRLKQWIDANPDVNWQWHHLPLPMHEPAATREALLAECAGEFGSVVVLPAPLAPIRLTSSPSTHLERHALDGLDAAVGDLQPGDLQQGACHLVLLHPPGSAGRVAAPR